MDQPRHRGQLIILAQRGQLDEAAALWAAWQTGGHRDEQGLPYTTMGAMLQAEATGRLRDGGALADRVWGRPRTTGQPLWALLSAPDVLRLARAAGDGDLAGRVVEDLSTVPADQVPSLAGSHRITPNDRAPAGPR